MDNKNLNIKNFSEIHFDSKAKNTTVLTMQLHEQEESNKKDKKI